MKEFHDQIQRVVSFVYSEPFKEWESRYEMAEKKFFSLRARLETLENMMARVEFSKETHAHMAHRIMENRLVLIEKAEGIDEHDMHHNKLLKQFESLRAESTSLWEKVCAEQIKTKPSQEKLQKLTAKHQEAEARKKNAEGELHRLWGAQGVIRLKKELLFWKSQRMRKASSKISERSSRYDARMMRLKKAIEEARYQMNEASRDFDQVKQDLPQGASCEFIENFVCFPMGHWALLYSLIDDNSLFPVRVERTRIYLVNMEAGFGSIRTIEVDEAAA